MVVLSAADVGKQLSAALSTVFGEWAVHQTSGIPVRTPASGFAEQRGSYKAWITSPDRLETVVLRCFDSTKATDQQRRLLTKLVTVTQHDLDVVGNLRVAQDIWDSLSESRTLRAATRLSPFATEPLIRWIRTFEAATTQTYEGSPFSGSVVMTKQLPAYVAHAEGRFHPFRQPISFDQALLREKWLKPFLQNGEFALVTVGHSGAAYGFADTSSPWPTPTVIAPTANLEGLYGHLRPGTSVLSATTAGDIHFTLPSGATFMKTQGIWRFQDWEVLLKIIKRHSEADVAECIVRIIKSASFARRGSLYVVLPAGANVTAVVPDHKEPARAAEALRSSVSGVNICNSRAVALVEVASSIDGAVLFDSDGRVIDVASMITEPSDVSLGATGHSRLQRFPGARSTAAWNASIHGIAVKVSDDGPIDVYEYGHHVLHAG